MTNSNSASNALNKWMKEHIPPQYVLHGFRHAMRDRLREVDCPADVMDEIGVAGQSNQSASPMAKVLWRGSIGSWQVVLG